MSIALSYPDGSYSASNKPLNETLMNDLSLIETNHNALETDFLVEHNGDGTHKTTLLSLIYPIGSIYINAAVSTNPSSLLGFGTWEAYASGKVIVGLDAGQTEFDTLGETGGAKTHTLVTGEMPSHTHDFTTVDNGGTTDDTVGQGASSTPNSAKTTNSTGGGGAHNNLQPYIVAYLWKRTA